MPFYFLKVNCCYQKKSSNFRTFNFITLLHSKVDFFTRNNFLPVCLIFKQNVFLFNTFVVTIKKLLTLILHIKSLERISV